MNQNLNAEVVPGDDQGLPTNPPVNRDDFDTVPLTDKALSGESETVLPTFRSAGQRLMGGIASEPDIALYKELHWQGSFEEYLARAEQNPMVLRNAWQRLSDMIVSYGVSQGNNGVPHYKIFDDPFRGGKDAIFGLDKQLNELVNIIRAGAEGYGPQNRLLLLHGPVGTAKSTIARVLKNGLERYSATEEGALYTMGFKLHPGHPEYDSRDPDKVKWCPMNEEPLRVVRASSRDALLSQIVGDSSMAHEIQIKGECCPACRQELVERLKKSGGDMATVLGDVFVKRLVFSEPDRIGIGTFQPKDEKNQDSTELSGDINYRKIAVYGSDSDPRAFNFDGEFNIANRGLLEMVEVLKLDTAFLYDLLGATQEHRIKPRKFAQTDIDEVVIGHTNEPEYRKLVSDDKMEALRDRILKVDIPYLTRLDDERRIYENQFKRAGDRIAPHTVEIAAMWAILTRLVEPNDAKLSPLQKLKLYNGEMIPGINDPMAIAGRAEELRSSAVGTREALEGISPRYVLDTISTALAGSGEKGLTPLMLLAALNDKLRNNAMIKDQKVLERYRNLLGVVRGEYEDIVKREVQEALAKSDRQALRSMGEGYLHHIRLYVERLETDHDSEDFKKLATPDERFMRAIEGKIGLIPSQIDDARRSMVNTIRHREQNGESFDPLSDDRLREALEGKLFEDRKDMLKLAAAQREDGSVKVHDMVKIMIQYMKRQFGYTEHSAREVAQLVSDIYARGEAKKS